MWQAPHQASREAAWRAWHVMEAMMGQLSLAMTPKCRRFVMAHWGTEGLIQVEQHPVSWVRHWANPYLKVLRRRAKKVVPLIAVRGTTNRIHLALSTEKDAKGA